MVYQAFPHNSLLLRKARRDATIAANLGEIRDFSPEEIEFLSKQGHTFTDDTLNMAEDVKQLLSEHPDLLSRSIQSWYGWNILHALLFDDYSWITLASPELIVTALFGQDLIHPDCLFVKYTPPDKLPKIVDYISKQNNSSLKTWFPILRKKQIRAHSPYTFDEAVGRLRNAMIELLKFYELVLERGNEGVVVDFS